MILCVNYDLKTKALTTRPAGGLSIEVNEGKCHLGRYSTTLLFDTESPSVFVVECSGQLLNFGALNFYVN
jgi:hypothetical protein